MEKLKLIHYADKPKLRLYERLSSITAAEAKSFTFSVAAMAGANVRVTTAV